MIKQKLNFISLGCAKALVDSEKLIGALKNTNYDITDNHEDADTMVINTCGFIDMARQESIDTILQATELKKKGTLNKLVVMGCLSERYPKELSKDIPEVDYFFGSNDHVKIMQLLTGKEFSQDDPIFLRSILTPQHYAYIKIAEGSHFTDVDGNRYLDYLCGLGPITLGYNYKPVNDAIIEQLKQGILFSLPHPIEVECSEEISKIIPNAEMVKFEKSGSNAVTGAVLSLIHI